MNEPFINVGLMYEKEIRFIFSNHYSCSFIEKPLQGEYLVKFENEIINMYQNDNIIYSSNEFNFEPYKNDYYFTLKGVTIGINFHWEQKENQKFNGKLKFIIENEKITAINTLPIEEYLTSVISSEMSAKSSSDLLKAHSIISRSWLLAQIEKNKKLSFSKEKYKTLFETEEELIKWYDREEHINYDVCADDHCQRYQGITKLFEKNSQQAVQETKGLVLYFNDNICDARFSKCCGGISENFENVWEPIEHPYLKMVIDNDKIMTEFDNNLLDENASENWIINSPDAFCNTKDEKILSQVLIDFDQSTKDFYRWKVVYSQKEVSELIKSKSNIDFGEIIDMIPIERGTSGRLIKLKIIGTKKTLIIGKELEIRRILSKSHLYSSAFIVKKENVINDIPQKFILSGAGWGHGVGLCQIGAAVMGEKGYSYEKILLHYFRGAKLKKLY